MTTKDSEQHEVDNQVQRPKRPWTILGRLSKAVREQNWIAVALELVIVVLGVVIGFQVTAWGQARSDRVQEREYLQQLAADLRETEQRMQEADDFNRPRGEALVKFIRAYAFDPRPPTDSLLHWGWTSYTIEPASPVLATAEALVSTGDIRLIRNDSLRTAITRYLDAMRLRNSVRQSVIDAFIRRYEQFEVSFDFGAAAAVVLSSAEMDSLVQTDYLFADAPTSGQSPYPDVSKMLDDMDLYAALRGIRDTRSDLYNIHTIFREAAKELATMVEAELNK